MALKTPREDKIPTVSGKESVILDLLLGQPTTEMYGLEIVRRSGKRLKRGTVYVTLSRLEDKGFIESREEAPKSDMPGMPRRLYKVTGHGQRVYALLQKAREASLLLPAYSAVLS